MTRDLVQQFLDNGGRIKTLARQLDSGITANDWKRLTRGEAPPVNLMPADKVTWSDPRHSTPITVRAGHGAVS